MDNESLQEQQRKIARAYLRQIANLVSLGRFTEAVQANIRFTGILNLWEIQKAKAEEAAAKDGCAAQRAGH